MDQTRINSLRDVSIPNQPHSIDGQQQPGESGEYLDVVSPIDGKV